MSGAYRENWKRLSNKYPPNSSASAMDAKDILRVEDLAASGVVTVSGVPANGDLLVGLNGTWALLGSGQEGHSLSVSAGQLTWTSGSGGGSGGVGPAGGPINVLVPTAATVTIAGTDYFVAVSGSTTVNLPTAPIDGERHIIKDSTGVAGTAPITVDGNGFPIDNTLTEDLVNNYASMGLIFSASLGRWQIV